MAYDVRSHVVAVLFAAALSAACESERKHVVDAGVSDAGVSMSDAGLSGAGLSGAGLSDAGAGSVASPATGEGAGEGRQIITRIVDGQLVIEEVPAETLADVGRQIARDLMGRDAGPAAPVTAAIDGAAIDGGDACASSRDAMVALQLRLRKDPKEPLTALAVAAESDALMRGLGTTVCRMDKRTRSARADLLALAGQNITDVARKREVLEESMSLEPLQPAAAALGDLAEERNDLRAALAYYDEAQALKATKEVASKRKDVMKKLAVEGDFVKRGNAHFGVSYEGSAREDLGDIALTHLESARTRLRDKIGVEPATTIQVVLYIGEQYQRALNAADWSGGQFDGKIRVREGQFKAASGELADVLTHEYVHALVRQSAPKGVPAWFNEGLAQYLEPQGNRLSRLSALRGMTRDKLPTFATMTRNFGAHDRRTANLYYACALQLLDELDAMKDERALRALFDELEAGQPFDAAFASAYGLSAQRFEERWRDKYPLE
jgi:hypothetical protein